MDKSAPPPSDEVYRRLRGTVETYAGRDLSDDEFKEVRQAYDQLLQVGDRTESAVAGAMALQLGFKKLTADIAATLLSQLLPLVSQGLRDELFRRPLEVTLGPADKQTLLQTLRDQIGPIVGYGRVWILLAFAAIMAAVALLGVNLFEAGRTVARRDADAGIMRLRTETRAQIQKFRSEASPTYASVTNLLTRLDSTVDMAVDRIATPSFVAPPGLPWREGLWGVGVGVSALFCSGLVGFILGRFRPAKPSQK